MKIKFSLQRSTGVVDLVTTVDSATTVGDLATRLLESDPQRHPAPGGDVPTLTVHGQQSLALDPRQPVADSGLRSGATVSIGRSSTAYVDPVRSAAAVVTIVEGPDAGREFEIGHGASVIGRERGCEVRLTDTMVSRRHARINVSDAVEIIDLGSANGIQIDDSAVPRSILRAADVVQVGDTRLSVRRVGGPSPDAATAAGVEFVRSPRLDPVFEGSTVEAPELPERGRNQRFPLIPLLAPLLMGGILYLITKSLTSIVFVALTPIMLLGTALESRLSGRSEYKKALADFWTDIDTLVTDLDDQATIEIARRRAEYPEIEHCLAALRTTSPLLWTRRPGVRGFCAVSLGHGTLPSRTTVELPSSKRATRTLYNELVAKLDRFLTVADVPVVAELAESALGVAGPRASMIPVARALLAQLALLHSPAEVSIAAVTSTTSAADWDWLKWLPHSSSQNTPIAARLLTSSPTGATALIAELEALLDERRTSDEDDSPHRVVLLVEADATVPHNRVAALAARGAEHGIHVVWLAAEVASLPAACATFVEIARDGVAGTAGYVHSGDAVEPLRLERLDAHEAAAMARAMSPIQDVDAVTDDASDLPRSLSLLALNGPDLAASPQVVIERWSESRSILTGPFAPSEPVKHVGSLRAVIGQSASEVHAVDLRADGPHALVGGTTGAGKSELLQAWILAMAAAHSPQRLTFLLVDYKGGAAFKDCQDLPHTVGLVTDLSPHMVRRALTSLSAELTRRERVLHQHNAKDLQELEKKGVLDAPPSLVLVVDEFAALVTDVPEFVDGVVNIAQRGRSLGIHLILATQRPAGVIKDNLRANTNLRLALRMADEADSADVLGSNEAAFFDPALPGRAVSKTGPGRLVPFQTGYAGGWTSDEPPAPDIHVEELSFGSPTVWEIPETESGTPVDPGPTDIERLVQSITGAASAAELPRPRKPWLPELEAVYDLADRERVPSRRTDAQLVFGICDDPTTQTQPTVSFNPDRDGNLAVFGTGGSGKSTLLRSLAVAAGFTFHGGPCHVYALDFGARGLAMLEDLPNVGSVIQGGDHERIIRLLGMLRSTIDERALRYSKVNAATITDYRRLADRADEPRILLMVDGVTAFRQAYEPADRQRWFDLFTSIAADGRPVGVQVVVSVDQRGGLPNALASAVQSRVVLRMASTDDYGVLGVPSDVLTPKSPPGRGVMADAEVQVAVLGGSTDVVHQSTAMRRFAESMQRSGIAPAPPIRSLPDTVALSSLPTSIDGRPVLGLASATLEPATFVPSGPLLVTGPTGSGRTTTMHALAESLRRWRPDIRLHYFGSSGSPLAQLSLWHTRVLSSLDASDTAGALTSEIASSSSPRAVFVENVAEWANGMGEMAMQQLAKQCVADGHLFVAEGETSSFLGSMGLIGQLKTGRAGIALTPDPGDGATVFKTNFPRLNGIEMPPGRGLFVRLGKAEVVQIGQPDTY